jgi:CD109 antigen
MAVMEVNVPSGFAINKDKLPNLLHYPEIKRFDTEDADSKLVVYFNGLNQTDVCPTVSAYRVFPVAKQSPSYVTVYDYYDNSRRARQFYSPPKAKICDICEEAQCTEECRSQRLQAQREADSNSSGGKTSSAINLIVIPPGYFFLLVTLPFLYLVNC